MSKCNLAAPFVLPKVNLGTVPNGKGGTSEEGPPNLVYSSPKKPDMLKEFLRLAFQISDLEPYFL